MSDFKNPDAGWYFDQYEAICKAGGKVSRGQFVSTCHIFRAAGYNEALAAAAPDGAELADVLLRIASAHEGETTHRVSADPKLMDYARVCSCGGWSGFTDTGSHRAHVAAMQAAALAPWVAQREAEAVNALRGSVRDLADLVYTRYLTGASAMNFVDMAEVRDLLLDLADPDTEDARADRIAPTAAGCYICDPLNPDANPEGCAVCDREAAAYILDRETRLRAVTVHVRESTPIGPDFCGNCSAAIADWVQWPCDGSARLTAPPRMPPPAPDPVIPE